MPINLSKGQKVDLTKKNPGLKNIMVGLGWDVNAFDSGADFDLDAAAFMLGSNGKCPPLYLCLTFCYPVLPRRKILKTPALLSLSVQRRLCAAFLHSPESPLSRQSR